MTIYKIRLLKSAGFTDDRIYALEAGHLGLYCIAFFGHKSTKRQRRQLKELWKQIINN